MTYLLHLDLPTWSNAGGVIVLPPILAVLVCAIVPNFAGWNSDE